jgi:hypothetical protein
MKDQRHTLKSSQLHPLVYLGMAGFAVWMIIGAWSFGGEGYADWLLVVVSLFILAVMLLVFVLSRVGSHDPGLAKPRPHKRAKFHDWAGGEFDTWQDKVRGQNAAIEVLLPLAAAAVGMTAIGIVYLAVHAG